MNEPFVFAAHCNFETVSEGIKRKMLAYGNELMAVEVHFDKDAVGVLHSHPHTQLSYVLEGEFEFEIEGRKKVVKQGDSVYKLPNLVHGCKCTKKGVLLDVFTPHREDFIHQSQASTQPIINQD